MNCPVDDHELETRRISTYPIATCGHCHGLWISAGARKKTRLPAERIPPASRRRRATDPATERDRMCPLCPTWMLSKKLSGVVIDICPKCSSVWLDAGEFDLVRDALVRPRAPRGEAPPGIGGLGKTRSAAGFGLEGLADGAAGVVVDGVIEFVLALI